MKEKTLLDLEHKHKMEEIEAKKNAEKEVENLRFDHQLQLQRIKSAEIQKTIQRRSF